jgi:hypothetical protein
MNVTKTSTVGDFEGKAEDEVCGAKVGPKTVEGELEARRNK